MTEVTSNCSTPGPLDDPPTLLMTSGENLATSANSHESEGPKNDDPSTKKIVPQENSLVATMAPYVPMNPGQSGPGYRRKNMEKRNGNQKKAEGMTRMFEAEKYDKFLTLQLEDGNIEDTDIFEVHREVVRCIGRAPKMSSLGRGGLLIEVQTPTESDKLKRMKMVNGNSASCTPHHTFNHTKGVIFSRELMKFSEEKLLQEFEDQKVIEVKRIMKKENGELCPQPLLILTFDLLKLPETISAAWHNIKVRPYIPSPRRCFYCQAFGHLNTNCRKKAKGEPQVCVNCGQESHGECSNTP